MCIRDRNKDVLIYSDNKNPDWSWSISVPDEGDYRVLSIGEGTDERNLIYIKFNKDEDFVPVIKEFKATYYFLGGIKNTLWFYTTLDAPKGKVISLNINDAGQLSWKDVIKESNPISTVSIVGKKIIVNYLKDTLTTVSYTHLTLPTIYSV